MKKYIKYPLLFLLVITPHCLLAEEVLDNIQREIFQLKSMAIQSEKNLSVKTKEYNLLAQDLKVNEDKLKVLEMTLYHHKEKIKKDFVQLNKSWGVLMVQQADYHRHAEYLLSKDKILNDMKKKSESLKSGLQYASKLEVSLNSTKDYYHELKVKTEVLLSLIQKLEQDKISLVGKIQSRQNESFAKEGKIFNQKMEQKLNNGELFVTKSFVPPLKAYEKFERSQQGISFYYRQDALLVAPSSGKVAYIGELANYGNVIMIEHDKHMMSVLLGDINFNISKDAIVTQGSVLGSLPADRDGGLKTVYYELRSEEKKVPTLSYLQI